MGLDYSFLILMIVIQYIIQHLTFSYFIAVVLLLLFVFYLKTLWYQILQCKQFYSVWREQKENIGLNSLIIIDSWLKMNFKRELILWFSGIVCHKSVKVSQQSVEIGHDPAVPQFSVWAATGYWDLLINNGRHLKRGVVKKLGQDVASKLLQHLVNSRKLNSG